MLKTKMTKTPKPTIFSRRILEENEPDYYSGKFFSRFYATFVEFSKFFMDQNVENAQQRMKSLSNTVFWGVKCSFVRTNSHKDRKIVEKSYFFKTTFDFPFFETFP